MALYQCATAQTDVPAPYDQPSQSMADALRQAASSSGWEIFFSPGDVNGLTAPPLRGRYDARSAVERLLAGTALTASYGEKTIIIRGRGVAPASLGKASGAGSDIVVTGSHIRGAPASAPVDVITRADMKKAGQTNLGEAIRSLPRNFNGGQNPGVAAGAGAANANVNGASSLNLRGLGADATLTLLNGHRLPYDSAFAGVDISAIPLAAVDRMEIVADGASALYGSDAVGGVANVILKRDFDGVEVTGGLGASTDGGNVGAQVNMVAGTKWAGGGFLVAYDFQRNSAISARQRDYTEALDDGATLYPGQRRHAVVLSAHHALTETLELSLDGLYNKRWTSFRSAPTKGRGYTYNGQLSRNTGETFSIAPSLKLSLANRWQLGAQLFYGRDNTRYNGTYYPATGTPVLTKGCYCDEAYSAEVTAEGPVIALPGGDLRVAVGAGYRSNGMDYKRATGGVDAGPFNVSRDSYYAYGEIYAPIVGAAQDIPGIARVGATLALRYERYPGLDEIVTPKLGLIFAPVDDLDIKASWGKSFKAPTLYQQYLQQETYLLPATGYGAGLPTGSTILYASGGNATTTPERAETWTATLALHPRAMPNLKLEASYFHVAYDDRVTRPISGSAAGILDKPAYAELLTLLPSGALQSALIAQAQAGLMNFSGRPYNPAQVVAVVDNRYRNVASQEIEGIDVSASFKVPLDGSQSLSLSGTGTYLKSRQQVTPALPAVALAGTVFNPPHLRGRAGASWDSARTTLSGFLNFTGPVRDNRLNPARKVSAAWTADIVGQLKAGGPRDGWDLTLSVLNLFNDKPDTIFMTGPTDTPYDSTNYSPIGRYVGMSIARRW